MKMVKAGCQLGMYWNCHSLGVHVPYREIIDKGMQLELEQE